MSADSQEKRGLLQRNSLLPRVHSSRCERGGEQRGLPPTLARANSKVPFVRISAESLDPSEQVHVSLQAARAALVADSVFNFGELVRPRPFLYGLSQGQARRRGETDDSGIFCFC